MKRVVSRTRRRDPVDGPFLDPSDPDGFTAAAMRAAVLGCEGKWGNDAERMRLANAVFSPSPEEIARARRVLEVADEAVRAGGGVAVLDNKPILMPQIRQAQLLVEQADMIGF